MEGKIVCLMTEGERALQRGGEGRVHSVYRKTINLMVNDHLYALQEGTSPLSPISFLLSLTGDEMHALPVKAQDRCRLSSSGITIFPEGKDPCTFFLDEEVLPVESSLLKNKKRLSPGAGESLCRQAEGMLMESGLPGFCAVLSREEGEDLILLAAKRILKEAEDFFATGKEEEGCLALFPLVGLGGGLTPSGDDLLCGFLSGLLFLGEQGKNTLREMKRLLPLYLNRTNDISRAFLDCALRGEFSLPVHHFFMGQGSLPEFLAIGHSSGMDTLLGIYLSLRSHSGCQPALHAPACI
ncbi:MAG: DUF2877 domain-containing protein [Blautia sp.]|nr:DUF2877 domain-containing protein [Blautia sp.]